MKLSEFDYGTKMHAALDMCVLVVLSRRVDGWCMYLGAVPGHDHSAEWPTVADQGAKQYEPIARAIAAEKFPHIEIDLPYAR